MKLKNVSIRSSARCAWCYPVRRTLPFDWKQFFKELFCFHHAVAVLYEGEKLPNKPVAAIDGRECHKCGKDMYEAMNRCDM